MYHRLTGSVALTAALALGCGTPAEQTQQEDYTERMAKEHAQDAPVAGAASMKANDANPREMTTREVSYATIDGQAVKGYLAAPQGGSKAAVIVIHEWWGLNDNIRTMAEKLAGQGYMALAIDLYGGQVATTPQEAKAIMSTAMQSPKKGQENIQQAHAWLMGEGAQRVGSIGWCFGGGWSLQTALMGRSDATVIYYGRLVTEEEKLSTLKTPILGIFGAEDQGIPVKSVKAFEATLKKLGKPHAIHVYEGANHAFANPSGHRYKPDAAQDAWGKTLAFLDKHLNQP
ncbi:MAG: dienelactone hydrolase family protein [Myxococcota bacterium]